MPVDAIRADLAAIATNTALREERHFGSRAEALDYLEFHVLDRINWLLQMPQPSVGLLALQQEAAEVRGHLEAIDATLFERLRADIRRGRCSGAPFRELVTAYVGWAGAGSGLASPVIGYDTLDTFINGLLPALALPVETLVSEPEMVFYQKTPARIICELVEKARLTNKDIFCDIGAGLGQVPILVHLLSRVTARGIEVEPAYCAYAKACAADLCLAGVTFSEVDARVADYSEGTVFFMYTPFGGQLLQAVLDRLRVEGQRRRIRLFTYGPCTLHVSGQEWLECVNPAGIGVYTLGEFRSIPAG